MRAFRNSGWRGVVLVLLVACADQREATVNQHLQQEIASQSGGALILSSFSKTNGYDQNMGGMTLYTLEWQARLTIQNDLWKNGGAFEGYWSSFGVMQKPPSAEDMIWARLGPTMPKEFVKGATVVLTGESQLQKTESGWRVLGSRVKTEQTLNNERSPAALAELQRQQDLAKLAQQKNQAAAEQQRAATADKEARDVEARKGIEALYMAARNRAVPADLVGTFYYEKTCSGFESNHIQVPNGMDCVYLTLGGDATGTMHEFNNTSGDRNKGPFSWAVIERNGERVLVLNFGGKDFVEWKVEAFGKDRYLVVLTQGIGMIGDKMKMK